MADCRIRHYHNYYVANEQRVYYTNTPVPEAIQFEQHRFIDAELCELFANLMVFAWYVP